MRLIALACLALLGGCAALPPVPDGEARLYVVGRGWHTDIGLPVDEIHGPLASLEKGFPGVRYMVFGFGERQFYMARHGASSAMLGALFPSDSAVLMTRSPQRPPWHSPTTRWSNCACRRAASTASRRGSGMGWRRHRTAQHGGWPTDLTRAACSSPAPRPTTRSPPPTPGPRWCCATPACRWTPTSCWSIKLIQQVQRIATLQAGMP